MVEISIVKFYYCISIFLLQIAFSRVNQQLKKFFQAKMTTIAVSASVLLHPSSVSNVSYLIVYLNCAHSSSKHGARQNVVLKLILVVFKLDLAIRKTNQ